MKGLILAGTSLAFFVVLCAAALRAYRGDREYKVFMGSLACSLALYVMLYRVLPSTLGFLPRTALEPSDVVDFWNGVLVVLMVFHGVWTFSYIVTGPTIRILTELSARRRQGLTLAEAVLQFQREDLGNSFVRRRLPKLINGGYVTMQDGAYVLLPRGRVVGGIALRVKQAIGDVEKG